MRARRAYLALVVVVLVSLGILYLERPDQRRMEAEAPRPLFPSLAADQVARIEIEHLLDGVQLQKEGAAWQVTAQTSPLQAQLAQQGEQGVEPAVATDHAGTPSYVGEAPAALPLEGAGRSLKRAPAPAANANANAEQVEALLQLLQTVQVGTVTSRNPENFDKLQVGKIGTQVRTYAADGQLLAHLIVGKQGPDYVSTYVRQEGNDAVYLVSDQLHGRFPAQVAQWRDRRVWALDPDLISKVSVERLDGGFTISKNAQGLFTVDNLPGAGTLNAEKVGAWFAQWATIQASKFAEGVSREQAGLQKPKVQVAVTMSDGTQHALALGGDAPGGVPYGELAGTSDLYVLSTSLRNTFKAHWQDWVPAKVQK